MVRQFVDHIERHLRRAFKKTQRLWRVIDEALSHFGIVAAAAEIVEISARLRGCVDDAVCLRQMTASDPNNSLRSRRCAAELM